MNTSLTINSTKNLIMWYKVTHYNALREFDKLRFICLIGGAGPHLGATRPRVGIC